MAPRTCALIPRPTELAIHPVQAAHDYHSVEKVTLTLASGLGYSAAEDIRILDKRTGEQAARQARSRHTWQHDRG